MRENKLGAKLACELIKSKIKRGVVKTLKKNNQMKRVANTQLKMNEYVKQLDV